MVVTQTQFNAALVEVNASFKELSDKVDALKKLVEEKPTTTKVKK
jgi:hypothetical protein